MSLEERRARREQAERLARKRRKRIGVVVFLLLLAVAVFAGLYFFVFKDGGLGSNDGAPSWTSGEDRQTEEETEEIAEDKPYYYEEALAERYEAFALARPELSTDEVIWMVDVNLDKDPYIDTVSTENPSSILALVNKYYYLPEDYAPEDIVPVGNTYMRQEAAEHMTEMAAAAAAEGLNVFAQSGYRSYATQQSLYDQYSGRDGWEAADTYSARAGYSEHQTGLVADLNGIADEFADMPEGQWVDANAYKYGFIVRYTPENTEITKYKYEPWHIRYIGVEAATKMHDLGIASFEEYWVKFVAHTPE